MDELDAKIVIDNGSSTIKADWSASDDDQDAPRREFPTTLGTPRSPDPTLRDYYVGYAAQERREILNMRYPIVKRRVTDWDDMEKIWRYTFGEELRIDPSDHSFVHTEAPLTPKADREKMTQIMFETFECESMYVACQASLALYASGRTTGVVVDSGLEVTHTVPIYEGYLLPHAVQRSNFGGMDMTRYQEEVLRKTGYTFNTQHEKEIIREIKEDFSYVALDLDEEIQTASNTTLVRKNFTLPDGNCMTLNTERFRAPEAFFDPTLAGVEDVGIHEKVYKSIIAVDICCRKGMYTNIILSGGNAMFDGLDARLQKEVAALAPKTMPVRVVASDLRKPKYETLLGGVILANLSSFEDMMIKKSEYDERGPTIVHEKCF